MVESRSSAEHVPSGVRLKELSESNYDHSTATQRAGLLNFPSISVSNPASEFKTPQVSSRLTAALTVQSGTKASEPSSSHRGRNGQFTVQGASIGRLTTTNDGCGTKAGTDNTLLQMGKYSTSSSNKIRGKYQPEQMASMAGFTSPRSLEGGGHSPWVGVRKFGDEQCQIEMMMGEYEM